MKTLARVHSLADLRSRAQSDPRYAKLAMIAASNLGGAANDLESALRWLNLNAQEVNEESLIDEVNHCRDLV